MREWFQKMNVFQDGTRSLFESIAIPEVATALKDWNSSQLPKFLGFLVEEL